MPTFEPGQTIRVPFPYTDRSAHQRRPALVVSRGAIGENDGLLWVVMITSAENRAWPGDLSLAEDLAAAGLSAPSVVRPCKIATIQAADVSPLGQVSPAMTDRVLAATRAYLGDAHE